MPDVVVEIAFNAGWSTPAASRTWTDVSSYVELEQGIDIGFGRSDELSTADANTLKVVLDNTGGRFTPEYASGANYPNVKVGKPIRVKATRVGGSAVTRFLGYVDAWTPSPAGANPTVTVTASSQLARLGTDSTLTASIDDAFAEASALYKLNETAEPAVDSRSMLPPLTVAGGSPTFAGGVGPNGAGTALRMNGGSLDAWLTGGLAGPVGMPSEFGIEAFFLYSGQGITVALGTTLPAGAFQLTLGVAPSAGLVDVTGTFGAEVGGPVSVTGTFTDDGLLHHLAVFYTQSAIELYVDGALVDSDTLSAWSYSITNTELSSFGGTGDYVDVAYVAITTDAAGIPERALGGRSGNQGDTASERLAAYATYAGVESTDFDATTETLTAYSVLGKTMLEAMRAAETTDGGVLFDSAAGALTYNDRESRYTSTSAFTLNAADQQVEASVAPKLDRSGLVNEATVTQTDGNGVLARVRDETSIADYGNARASWEIQGGYDACLQAAAWSVFIHGDPETRIPNLEVDLLPLSGSLQDSLLAATVGTRLTVSGLTTDFPASSLDFFLEGYTETIGPETYRLTFNVSKRDSAKWDVWTVEDATYGAYDSNPIAW